MTIFEERESSIRAYSRVYPVVFKTASVTENGQSKSNGAAPGKGINQELQAFVDAALGGPLPIDEAELIETSTATIAALESLQSGDRIDLS